MTLDKHPQHGHCARALIPRLVRIRVDALGGSIGRAFRRTLAASQLGAPQGGNPKLKQTKLDRVNYRTTKLYTLCIHKRPPQAAKVAHFAIFAFLACDARAICHAAETRAGAGLPRNRLILAVRQHFNYGSVAYSWRILAIRLVIIRYGTSPAPARAPAAQATRATTYRQCEH